MVKERHLYTARYVVSMDGAGNIYSPGYIETDGGIIKGVGLEKDMPAGDHKDYGNAAIIPGLINSHTHSAMTLFRGFADDLALDEWLEKHIWPLEGKFLSPGFVRAGAKLAALEMLKAGVTLFADMYFFEDEVARSCSEVGIRVLLGEGVLAFPTASSKDPNHTFDHIERQIKTYKGDELVGVLVAAHSTYATSEEQLQRCAEYASLWDIPLEIHCAETEKESKECLAVHGKSQVQYLESLGLLDVRVGLVHMVWPEESDSRLLKRENVSVVLCPQSNLKLASGIPPVAGYVDEGIRIALGTDGAASNNNLDIWEEMRLAAFLAKGVTHDPTKLLSKKALRMVTIDAAHAWGLGAELGSLEAGKKADMVVVNLDKPHTTPCYDVCSTLVYAAGGSDVQDVYVSGKKVLENRNLTTANEERIIRDAGHWIRKIKKNA